MSGLRRFLKRSYHRYVIAPSRGYRYFGTQIYYPRGSATIDVACHEGIYEAENIAFLQALVNPSSYYIDVGANLGFTSVPLLARHHDLRVLSIEPSPVTVQFLRKTASESPWSDRWIVVAEAVGETVGETAFHYGDPKSALYDGLRTTTNSPDRQVARVPLTTIDTIWNRLGRPFVSAVKLDIEGGELHALRGAASCIAENRPYVLTEWWPDYLAAYNVKNDEILDLAADWHYSIIGLPRLQPVTESAGLKLQQLVGSYLLLVPVRR